MANEEVKRIVMGLCPIDDTYECLDVCKAVEEYGMKQRNEGVQEGIAKSIMRVINQGKLSYDEIAEGFDVSIDEVRKLAAQMN